MSQLQIKARGKTFKMNVLSFTAPLFGNVSTVQTKTMQQHFPVRANQPNIQFSVIFTSEKEFKEFGEFIRELHVHDLDASINSKVGVNLWWPEREIDNWTGIIKNFEAGAHKGNWAPRATFSVDLVDSWVSRKTSMASFGSSFSSIFEDSPLTRLFLQGFAGFIEDAFLRLPIGVRPPPVNPNIPPPNYVPGRTGR